MITQPLIQQPELLPDVDPGFIDRVLTPYHDHCHYLKNVSFREDFDNTANGIVAEGEFSIMDSCYIDDTGHFNAVEYNICYNQLGYVFLAYNIKNKLLPELGHYSIDKFFEKQLSNVLIIELHSHYKRPIDARHFYGVYGIKEISQKKRFTLVKTFCHCYDDNGGDAGGDVTLAILHP